MSTVQIHTAFAVTAYRMVHSEEGSYESPCGHNVIAHGVADENGYATTYIRRGDVGDVELPSLYHPADPRCFDLVAHLERVLEIDTDAWIAIEVRDIHALPDYVTDPHRPEFN